MPPITVVGSVERVRARLSGVGLGWLDERRRGGGDVLCGASFCIAIQVLECSSVYGCAKARDLGLGVSLIPSR